MKVEYERVEVEWNRYRNRNFKIAISFHSSIFGMEWKEIATPLKPVSCTLTLNAEVATVFKNPKVLMYLPVN